MKTIRRTFAAMAAGAILTAGLTMQAGPALAQGKVLKFVQNGNLTILDPIWTTAYVTRNHGYLIYDTLFASDENNAVKPASSSWTSSRSTRRSTPRPSRSC